MIIKITFKDGIEQVFDDVIHLCAHETEDSVDVSIKDDFQECHSFEFKSIMTIDLANTKV